STYKSLRRVAHSTNSTVLMPFFDGVTTTTANMLCFGHFQLWDQGAFCFTTMSLCQRCFEPTHRACLRCAARPKGMRDVFSPRSDELAPGGRGLGELRGKIGRNPAVAARSLEEIRAPQRFTYQPIEKPCFNRWPYRLNQV